MRRALTSILVALLVATALTAADGSAVARRSGLVDQSPPHGVWVALTGDHLITWSWEAVPGATGYRIAVSKSATMSSPTIRTVTGRVASFDGLKPGTRYYAVVRAMDADNTSGPSAKTPGTPGAVAKPIGEVVPDHDQVNVRWAPYVGASKYAVYTSPPVQIFRVAGRTFSMDVERDSYGYFKVRALNSSGHAISDWSPLIKVYVPYRPV